MAKDQSDILKEILKQSKNPKAIERAQSELADASKRKAEIAAEMRGSISAPIARSTTELSEVTKETGRSEVANSKLNENLANLVKESKDQNTNLKKIIKLNEKSIEDNSELFARLEKTMNALLDSVSEQGRKEGRFGVKGGVDGGVESSNKKQEDEKNPIWEKIKDMLGIGAGAAAGAATTKALSKDAAKAAAKPSLLRRAGKFGLLGAGAGFLTGALSGEDNQVESALAGGALGLAGGALYEGGKALLTPKAETPKIEPPKVEPKVEPKAEPRYKFNEKTGRFHDTMKGVGGGEMISDAKAKELGLEKPITEETTKAAEKTEAKVVEKTTEKAAGKVEAKTAEKVVAGAETEVAKDAVKAVEKGGAKEAVQKGGASAVKEAVAKLGPKFAKGLVKAVPFVGALAGLAFAIGRATEGDWKGAAAEAASGGASIFAGPGTAASVAIDVGLLVRDVYKAVHGVFPDDDPEFSQEKMTEVKTAVTDYVSGLLPQSEEKKKEEEKNKNTTPGSAPPPPSPTTPEKDITETSVDEEEIYKSLTADLPEAQKNDVSVQQDYREQAKIQAKANAKKATQTEPNRAEKINKAMAKLPSAIQKDWQLNHPELIEQYSNLSEEDRQKLEEEGTSTNKVKDFIKSKSQTQKASGTITPRDGESASKFEKRKQLAEEQQKQDNKTDTIVKEFAEKMGIDPNKISRSELVAGVPTQINGVSVPKELYSEEQVKKIDQANKMKAQMSSSDKILAGENANIDRKIKEDQDLAKGIVKPDPLNDPYYEKLRNKGSTENPDRAGQLEVAKTVDTKTQQISEQQQPNNQAPIIINQGDNINNVTNNTTAGGNSGGGGSPTRIPSPWDALTLGKPWEAYP